MHRFVLPLLLVVPLLFGCGEGEPEPIPARHWNHCEIGGVADASGLTVLEGTLLLCAGRGDRGVYVVPVASLRSGGRTAAKTLEVEVARTEEVMGRDDLLVTRGATLGELWDAQVDFQGIATQRPRFLYLADRAHRVVFWGELDRDVGGAFTRVGLRHGFVAPGATRGNVDFADYRDTGPGIAGLFGVSARKTEDLYLVERAHGGAGDPQHEFRVLALDRYGGLGGSSLGFFVVRVPGDGPPDVEAVSWHEERFLFVRGPGRGALAPVKNHGLLRTVDLGQPTPGPELSDGRWRGMVHGPDGTLYLVSDGDPAVIAWRAP